MPNPRKPVSPCSVRRGVAGLALLLLAACGADGPATEPADGSPTAAFGPTPAPGTLPDALADTEWQLVEFRSMDDEQGVTAVGDRSRFRMTLMADGRVALALDCNRAVGNWSAQASMDGDSGRFEFGPLAVTRALCPPPRLDERIARDAEYIRGYLFRDGRLYLSLMADGGIYVWEPVSDAVAFESTADPEIEAAILAAAPQYTRELVDLGGPDDSRARYVYSRFDLNEDGQDEVLVFLMGSFFCGTGGCNLMLFSRMDSGLSLVNDFPTTRTPVIVGAAASEGWRDIWRSRSGGGAPANFIEQRFDGMRYIDGRQIPADEPPVGIRVLAGEPSFADGVVLEPVGP